MKELRYTVVVDGHEICDTMSLHDAKFHAESALLDAEYSYVYDAKTGETVAEFWAEDFWNVDNFADGEEV